MAAIIDIIIIRLNKTVIKENPASLSTKQRVSLVGVLSVLYLGCLLIAAPPYFVIIGSMVLIPWLIWLTITDLEHLVIPDIANIGIALSGLMFLLWHYPDRLIPHMIAGCVAALLFWTISIIFRRLRGYDGLGMGDTKFIFGCGLWVGLIGVINVIFLASIIGILATLCVNRLSNKKDERYIPFGPFLAFSTFYIWLFGPVL
ncbi:prepilin peptidase [Amylibacter sp. SFDW26]|uniref:prepilin peptidase n=1 Tax=Amylibacter sp. SFDW26 TaxID=2652722 RepID=UPI001262919E|nr:A24 family peptidase [Amylibacter sp. SFDW26]KAB7610194.1 prepilin peptidase [Amylibacter sp. SFDW26]